MPEKKKNLFTRVFKNPWKSIFILLLLAAILRWWSPRKATSTETESFVENKDFIVWTGDLETSLTIQGTTQFSDSQKLTFMNKGKVRAVNVKVGDTIKKWQILATITTDDLDEQVQQAKINLDDANQALQDLLSSYNLELEYLQQKANYDALLLKQKTIDQDHALALAELKQKIIASQQQVQDAQKSYKDTKANYEELLSGSTNAMADLALSSTIRNRNKIFQNAVLEVKNIITTLQTNLDTFDQRMLLSDTYKYQEKNIYVGAKDINLKNQSETLFWTLSSQLSEVTTKYKMLEALPLEQLTNEQILELYTLIKHIGTNLVTWGEISYEMFKASIENTLYSQTQIDKDASNALGNQSLGISYIQRYTSMVDSLATIKEDTSLEDTKLKLDKAQTTLEQAQISVNKLELSVEVLLAEQEKEKATLLDQIETAQRNIVKIQKGESLNESKVKQARNTVTQRKNSLDSLMDKYADYRLEANFDGVITQMDIQIWDSIDTSSNSTPKYIYIENNNILEMVLSVEQVDIVKLKMGMEVIVYLDAYSDSTYHGVITEINTIPTTAGGITTYSVTVTFEKNYPEEVILAGMGGNAKILVAQTKNVLLVPSQAISRKDGKNVVLRRNSTVWEDREVEVWTSDEYNIEILSGLALGDRIKAMYMTLEGMEGAGISTVGEEVESLEDLMRQNRSAWGAGGTRNYGGNAGAGTTRPTGAGGGSAGNVNIRMGG